MLNQQQRELLRIADEENGVTIDFGSDIYNHKSSVSRTLKNLTNKGLFEKKEAPSISQYEHVWVLTEKGRTLL